MRFIKFVTDFNWKHSFDRKYEGYKRSTFLIKCSPDLLNDFDNLLDYSYERSKVIRAFMKMCVFYKKEPSAFINMLKTFIEN